MPAGRPVEPVPQDVAEKLLDHLFDGGSILSFCEIEGMPTRRTIYDWRDKDAAFDAQVTRALAACGDVLSDKQQKIADDGTNDWMEIQNAKGECVGWRINGEAVQRSKLRVDVMQRRAASLNPAVHSQKAQVEHKGAVAVNVVTNVPEPKA